MKKETARVLLVVIAPVTASLALILTYEGTKSVYAMFGCAFLMLTMMALALLVHSSEQKCVCAKSGKHEGGAR